MVEGVGTHKSRRITELIEALATIGAPLGETLDHVLPVLRDLLRAQRTLAYAVSRAGRGYRLEFLHAVGFPSRMRTDLSRVLAAAPEDWAHYDPGSPQPEQRNIVLTTADLVRLTGREQVWIKPRLHRQYGVEHHDQLRVLVCDGPALLAWVGALRPEPFEDRERAILHALAPLLQRRMALEARLASSGAAIGLVAQLEGIATAAFLLDGSGAVLHANAAGQALFDLDRNATTALLRTAVAAPESAPPVTLHRLAGPGSQVRYLATLQPRPDSGLGLRSLQAAVGWGLTSRQIDVLVLLARGLSDRAIATTIAADIPTVLAHVAALQQRAGARSRAELLARVLQHT